MAKPKACQTPNAEMTPISSNPANKPELERPFKAERCPGEPGSFCGPWVGPVTAPLRVGLQQEGAGGTPPVPKGRQEGAGVRQQPPGERADPAACCTLEPRGTESRAAEVPWAGAAGLSRGWVRFCTSRVSCWRVGSCGGGRSPSLGSAVGTPNHHVHG